MLCLGIESTAHTFSCAILESDSEIRILSDVRNVYRPPEGSGIHPREASRHHVEVSRTVLSDCLEEAGIPIGKMDIISYAAGPGLGPCLRVGAVVARALSSYHNIPIYPVNHAIGHIDLGMALTKASDPLILLVSGGHTMLLALVGERWRVFGETLDITLGQMLDQFGRSLGMPSPCGEKIESLASRGKGYVQLPYYVKGNDVSFSGLLSAAKAARGRREDLAYSIQETAFAMICEAVERALSFTGRHELLVVGGVAANRRLYSMLSEACDRYGCRLLAAPVQYSGDCGSQIACTGIYMASACKASSIQDAFVRQSWRLDTVDIPYRPRVTVHLI